MLRKINLKLEQGSLMIEAIAMLGLISMVTPVIYKKAAERTTEMQDVNAASEVRVVVKAIDDYLRDNYTTITAGESVTSNGSSQSYAPFKNAGAQSVTVVLTHFSAYLPIGFKADGKTFKDFKVAIKKVDDPQGERRALTAVLVAENSKSDNFNRIRSSRIASMIGTNGGFIVGGKAQGVQGVWEIKKEELPIKTSPEGTIVATSIQAVADGTAGGKNVLHRVETPGRKELNTMETTLFMGSNDVAELENLISAGEEVTLRRSAGLTGLQLNVKGSTIIDNTLEAASKQFLANSQYMQHNIGLYVGGDTTADKSAYYVDAAGAVRAATGAYVQDADSNITSEGTLDSKGWAKLVAHEGSEQGYVASITTSAASINPMTFLYAGAGPNLVFNAGVAGRTKGGEKLKDNSAGVASVAGTGSQAMWASNKITNYSPEFYVQSPSNAGKADFFNSLLTMKGDGSRGPGETGPDGSPVPYGNRIDMNANVGITGGVDIYGHLMVDGNITGHGNLGIGNAGVPEVFQVDGATGNTVIKGTTTGWGDLQIGNDATNAVNKFLVKGDTGNTEIQGTTTGRGNLAIGATIGAEGFTVDATSGDTNAAGIFKSNFTKNANGTMTAPIFEVNSSTAPVEAEKGSVYVRKGVVEIATNDDTTKSAPTGYIKADRLLANQGMDTKIDYTGSHNYSEYQVNPAYTSMMHDIKLATRGGARLSDILPDFINKGIYVLDNTYYGDVNWETTAVSGSNGNYSIGLGECGTDVNCDSSPWLGFIPSPNCPAGYMKVATITPIRFNMAQAGIPQLVNGTYKMGVHRNPAGDANRTTDKGITESNVTMDGVTTGVPFVEVYSGDGSYRNMGDATPAEYKAIMYNAPYNFQVSTWLNTTLKAYRVGNAADGAFRGWHGIMGFIYPAQDYEEYYKFITNKSAWKTPGTSDIFWNLFTVYKEELSAIATIYCYFDRKNTSYNDAYVDKYLPHEQAIGDIRSGTKDTDGAYEKRLNDPKLPYTAVW